jgi:hypothetical protein
VDMDRDGLPVHCGVACAAQCGHGENVAVGSYELLTARTVRPKDNISQGYKDNYSNLNNSLDCSGLAKRKLSGRTGRWWPSSGWRSKMPRRPWRRT